MFVLKLIQSLDVSLEELITHLNEKEFAVQSGLVRKFENTILNINIIGIRFLLDIVDSIGTLVSQPESLNHKFTIVNRNSVIGELKTSKLHYRSCCYYLYYYIIIIIIGIIF